MRAAVVCLCLLGCGRVGFDVTGDGGSGSGSGSGDTLVAQSCSATQLAVTLTASPTADVIAAELPGGIALGFLVSSMSELRGVVIDDALVPNTSSPHQTSPLVGFPASYTNGSLFWDGAVLVGSLSDSGGCYLKRFPPDMTQFLVSSQRTGCLTGEPSVGKAAAHTVSTWYSGSTLFYNELMVDGNPGTTDRSVVMPAAIENLSVASGERVVVALDVTNGECDFMLTDGSGNTNSGRLIPTCARPHIRATGGSTFTYVFEDTLTTFGIGQVEVTATTYASMPPTRGYAGRFPRQFAVGGDVLVVFRKADDTLAVMRAADGTLPAISGLPAAVPDAFDTAGPYVFATFGDQVYAITCN